MSHFAVSGMISPSTEWLAAKLTFTPDRWKDASYLWLKNDRIYCSFVWARTPRRGHFRELVQAIQGEGYDVAVPTPLMDMEAILRHWGWRETEEINQMGDPVSVWVPPKKPHLRAIYPGKKELPVVEATEGLGGCQR